MNFVAFPARSTAVSPHQVLGHPPNVPPAPGDDLNRNFG